MKVTANSIVQSKPDLLIAPLDKRVVAMNVEDGNYYDFDEIATIILNRIKEPVKVFDLCNGLAKDFNVLQEECLEDVLVFLGKMEEAGFLTVK